MAVVGGRYQPRVGQCVFGVIMMTLICNRYTTIVLAMLLITRVAGAQPVSGNPFRLMSGTTVLCVERSDNIASSPEGRVVGNVCDRFVRFDTGQLYYKMSGTGNTGWITWSSANLPSWIVSRSIAGAIAVSSITTGITENLVLNPTADLITNPAGKDILPNANYDIRIGSPPLKYLSLSVGELLAETLVAQDVIATIGGRILVAPTTVLVVDLSPAGTTITVKHNQMTSGDIIYLQTSPGGIPQVEFMAITSGAGGSAGAYTYTVTRNLDGSSANQWYAGDAVLNTGIAGKGLIDIYSTSGVLSGSGPSIVGNIRTGSGFSNIEPRFVLGNLNGLFGYGTDLYGAAFGQANAAWIKIDTTNGVRIGHNATTFAQINASGVATFTGAHSGDGASVTNINGGNIQTDTITATQIAANAITTSELSAGSVTAAKIVAGTITATEIAANTITAAKLNVTALSAITANLGAVTAGSIDIGALTFVNNLSAGGAYDMSTLCLNPTTHAMYAQTGYGCIAPAISNPTYATLILQGPPNPTTGIALTLGTTGNATSGGENIDSRTGTSRGSGNNYFNFTDPTGLAGQIGYVNANSIFYINNIIGYIDFYPAGAYSARLWTSGGMSLGNTTDPGAANMRVSNGGTAQTYSDTLYVPGLGTFGGLYIPSAAGVGVRHICVDASGNVVLC